MSSCDFKRRGNDGEEQTIVVSQLQPEISQQLTLQYSGDFNRLVHVGDDFMIFPRTYLSNGQNCIDFKPRSSDIFIMGFPCSGVLDLAWMLLHLYKIDVNHPQELSIHFAPLLESAGLITDGIMAFSGHSAAGPVTMNSMSRALKVLEEMEENRIIRTHLPFNLLNPDLLTCGCKIIYIVRSPRDVVASMYEVHRKRRQFNKDLDAYVDMFLNNLILYTPYWAHIRQAREVQLQENPNVMLVCYDALKQDWNQEFADILRFIKYERTPESNERIETMFNLYHNVVDKFQADYVQVGLDDDFVGEREDGHKLSNHQRARIAEWVSSNKSDIGLDMPYFC